MRQQGCTGSLNQIIESIPGKLHKDLYHTLFESYITYGIISVWGGTSDIKGAGGVPDLGMVKIEFYNVYNRKEPQLPHAFYRIKKYCF